MRSLAICLLQGSSLAAGLSLVLAQAGWLAQPGSQASPAWPRLSAPVLWVRAAVRVLTCSSVRLTWLPLCCRVDDCLAVHYIVLQPLRSLLEAFGRFQATVAWFNDTKDPFGRCSCAATYLQLSAQADCK